MSKPTIFFSHSSRDQAQLVRLKELFIEKTGGSIDVFLTCDGQSIPLGRNWVHQIEEALEYAPLMVVFVSPNSLRSSWLFFESGFAYSKGGIACTTNLHRSLRKMAIGLSVIVRRYRALTGR